MRAIDRSLSAYQVGFRFADPLDFSGRSLRDVYDTFINFRARRDANLCYFIVADRSDFQLEGALGIRTDCAMNYKWQIGVARVPGGRAMCWGTEIQTGGIEQWETMERHEAYFWGPNGLTAPVAQDVDRNSMWEDCNSTEV
ncbi:hypothetical protein E8E11_004999 [Didymella keratinophila]|nr:hypothetical protein E8E11_004999 [Didymella keratinophila]